MQVKAASAQTWFRQCKHSVSKEYIIVAQFSCNKKLKNKSEKKVESGSTDYQMKILGLIFTKEILSLHPFDF